MKKNILKGLLIGLVLGQYHTAHSQATLRQGEPIDAEISPVKSLAPAAIINLQDVKSHMDPVLLYTGIYHENEGGTPKVFAKELLPEQYIHNDMPAGAGNISSRQEDPKIIKSFNGYNDSKYTPPDNSVAVSNNGTVLSVMNSNMRIFKITGGNPLYYTSFYDMYKNVFTSIKGTYFDPKVLYDPKSDRFIVVVLNGSISDSSRIVVMFSKTNDPTGSWNMYSLDGNVLQKNNWTDYPNIGISDNDLYITGNLFDNGGSFTQAFIIQIGKAEGYNGTTLNYRNYSNLRMQNNGYAFTVIPAQYGLGTTGPEMYFAAHEQGGGRQLSIFKIDKTLASGSAAISRLSYTYSTNYTQAGYGSQKGQTDVLNCGDTRIKQAINMNGYIHYVFTAQNANNGNTDNVYARADLSSTSLYYNYINGAGGTAYAYPSICSLAPLGSSSDTRMLISYLRSSANLYPEMAVIAVAGSGATFDYSSSIQVKAGLTGVNVLGDNVERWGDYTGLMRKYNSNDAVFSGCYGNGGAWSTFLADIGLASTTGIEPVAQANDEEAINMYPNPTVDRFDVKFKQRSRGPVYIALYDIQGRQVAILHNAVEDEGEKTFSFNRASLPAGSYTLQIRVNGKDVSSKKLVVE